MDTDLALTKSVRVIESDLGPQVLVDASIYAAFSLAIYGNTLKSAAERLLRRAVRSGACSTGAHSVAFPSGDAHEAQALAETIRNSLKRMAHLPIEQNRVEAALKISRKECNRWTKDGRLPTSGTLIISRAPNLRIQRSTYAPEVIAGLAAHPERIDAWRAEDLRQP